MGYGIYMCRGGLKFNACHDRLINISFESFLAFYFPAAYVYIYIRGGNYRLNGD